MSARTIHSDSLGVGGPSTNEASSSSGLACFDESNQWAGLTGHAFFTGASAATAEELELLESL